MDTETAIKRIQKLDSQVASLQDQLRFFWQRDVSIRIAINDNDYLRAVALISGIYRDETSVELKQGEKDE